MSDPSTYSPNRSLAAKIQRRLTYWRAVKPLAHTPKRGIVSFTFDDFPRSAAQYGVEALDAEGVKGTFYTCTGLRDRTNIMGKMYSADDLTALVADGHELGAHTHSHLDCSAVGPETVQHEIEKNLQGLEALGHTQPISQFAWPYGETSVRNKAIIADMVTTSRGILPGINGKGADLMQLGAFELTPCGKTTARASKAIETAARKGGWVVIFTHDVQKEPSPFGTTPEALKALVRQALSAGLDMLPMGAAYTQIEAEASKA